MAPRRRWLVLLAALGATLAASFYRSDERLAADTRTQAPAAPERTRQQAIAETTKSPVIAAIPERLQARQMADGVEDAFAIKSWAPPPPPPPPPKIVPRPAVQVLAPPPRPGAPPLPYRYLGRLEDAGVVTIFLGKGDANFAVKPGDTLEGNYRLDAFQGHLLTFTYLPLQQQQTLPVGQPN